MVYSNDRSDERDTGGASGDAQLESMGEESSLDELLMGIRPTVERPPEKSYPMLAQHMPFAHALLVNGRSIITGFVIAAVVFAGTAGVMLPFVGTGTAYASLVGFVAVFENAMALAMADSWVAVVGFAVVYAAHMVGYERYRRRVIDDEHTLYERMHNSPMPLDKEEEAWGIVAQPPTVSSEVRFREAMPRWKELAVWSVVGLGFGGYLAALRVDVMTLPAGSAALTAGVADIAYLVVAVLVARALHLTLIEDECRTEFLLDREWAGVWRGAVRLSLLATAGVVAFGVPSVLGEGGASMAMLSVPLIGVAYVARRYLEMSSGGLQ